MPWAAGDDDSEDVDLGLDFPIPDEMFVGLMCAAGLGCIVVCCIYRDFRKSKREPRGQQLGTSGTRGRGGGGGGSRARSMDSGVSLERMQPAVSTVGGPTPLSWPPPGQNEFGRWQPQEELRT